MFWKHWARCPRFRFTCGVAFSSTAQLFQSLPRYRVAYHLSCTKRNSNAVRTFNRSRLEAEVSIIPNRFICILLRVILTLRLSKHSRHSRVEWVFGTTTAMPPRRPPKRVAPGWTPEDPSKCTKFTLFFLNVLFWLIAVFILAIGIYLMIEQKDIYNKLTDFTLNPGIITVVLGGLLFVITFTGCVGALRENTCLLYVYAALVGAILLCELTAGVLVFVFREKAQEKVDAKLRDAIIKYRDEQHEDLQLLMDTAQVELKCCGSKTYEDWNLNLYFNCSKTNRAASRCGVPYTCCKTAQDRENRQCGFSKPDGTHSDVIYTEGCMVVAIAWFKDNLLILGIVAFTVLLLQIISLCLATSLRSQVQNVKDSFGSHGNRAWNPS